MPDGELARPSGKLEEWRTIQGRPSIRIDVPEEGVIDHRLRRARNKPILGGWLERPLEPHMV